MKKILKLYINGETAASVRAINNLQKIVHEYLEDQYEIDIIDILKAPKLAVDESIVATPTLIKELPPPISKIIGDLSDTENVLFGLGLKIVSDRKQ